jgi:hypothetical protein
VAKAKKAILQKKRTIGPDSTQPTVRRQSIGFSAPSAKPTQGFQYLPLLVLNQTSSGLSGDFDAIGGAGRELVAFGSADFRCAFIQFEALKRSFAVHWPWPSFEISTVE